MQKPRSKDRGFCFSSWSSCSPRRSGIGSVHGALVAALLVGVIDTVGRVTLPTGFGNVLIYVLMAMVLVWRPRGLFPAHG